MKIKMNNIGQSIQEQIQKAANTVEETVNDIQNDRKINFPDVHAGKETGFSPPVPYPAIEGPNVFDEKTFTSVNEKGKKMADQFEKRLLESKKLIRETKVETTEGMINMTSDLNKKMALIADELDVANETKMHLISLKHDFKAALDQMTAPYQEIRKMRVDTPDMKTQISVLKEHYESAIQMFKKAFKAIDEHNQRTNQVISRTME
jgi:hypothetical protein